MSALIERISRDSAATRLHVIGGPDETDVWLDTEDGEVQDGLCIGTGEDPTAAIRDATRELTERVLDLVAALTQYEPPPAA
jgi:hypothetical protein